MRSSQTSTDQPGHHTGPVVLVAGAGAVATPAADARDPYEALDDLMAVVEALCPSWPPRPGFGPMPDLRL